MNFSERFAEEPIAIVAAACRLPGGKNVDSFWTSVRQGKTSIGPIPESRFNRRLYYDPKPGTLNKTYTDLAALVEYPAVDRAKTPLPPNAENEYDVAHLAFAESVADVCRSAGFDPARFPIRNSGVFVGHTRPGTISQDWQRRLTAPETINYLNETEAFRGAVADSKAFCRKLQERAVRGTPEVPRGARPSYLSSDVAILAARMLKIDGGAAAFNSACASSLHAVGQAALALRNRRIDAAFAGGSTFFHSDTLLLFASSRSMTKNRSCPFDKDADGLVIGEGNVVFLMKRLSDALAANDPVLAVLTGIGFASDGKGKSLWAPRKEGQIEAIRKAYRGGIELSDVDYVEAHATSTALGDATEIDALTAAFGDSLQGRAIPLGSAKGNIGHTLEVAGAAGILKAALVLSHGIVPPIGGLRTPNPNIPWDSVPFFAPMKEQALASAPGGRPRRAAVNSFGIGGLNVHLTLDEYVPEYWRDVVRTSRSKHVVFSEQKSSVPSKLPAVVSNSIASTNKNDWECEPIAVVGRGCILPDAYSVPEFREFLASGKNAFRTVAPKIWEHEIFRRDYLGRDYSDAPPFLAGTIDKYVYDWKKNKLPPKQIENASPIQFMMLDATNEAFAEYGETSIDERLRTGVVVGSCFGGDFSVKMNAVLALPALLETLRDALREEGVSNERIETIATEFAQTFHRRMPALLDETGSFTPSALASRITKTLDLMGGAVAVESEGGSFGAALLCCVDQLERGCNDLMVAIGGQQDLGPSVYDLAFGSGVLARRPEISPFDADADGSVFGEGCGVLLLKRLSDAKRDGDRIFAIVDEIGVSIGKDVYSNRRESIRRATRDVDGAAHSALPDALELPLAGIPTDVESVDAIADWVSEEVEKSKTKRPIRLGSLASRFGNFGAGSGVAACLKAILELEQNAVFAEAGLTKTSPFFERRKDFIVPADVENAARTPVDNVGVATGEQCAYYIRLRK